MTLTLEQLLYVDEELPLDDDDEMFEKAARILQQLRPTWDREKIDFRVRLIYPRNANLNFPIMLCLISDWVYPCPKLAPSFP